MQNLLVRSISGLFYVIIILLGCLYNEYSPTILAITLGFGAIYEWQSLKSHSFSGLIYSLSLIVFLGLLVYYSPVLILSGSALSIAAMIILAVLLSLIFYQSFAKSENSISTLSHNTFGLIYISLPLLLMIDLIGISGTPEPWLLAAVFILIWCSDSFAYLVGRFLGNNKLFERISPNKTWEGFFGGLVFTLLGAYLLFRYIGILSLTDWLVVGALVSSIGTLGDLFESAVKRRFQIKDSGNLIPGHGGVLDRIDSFLFALPVVYFYLNIVLS